MTQNQKGKRNRNGSRESKNRFEAGVMDSLIEEMAEYICDELCKHTENETEEGLLRRCDECRINEFQRKILNECR